MRFKIYMMKISRQGKGGAIEVLEVLPKSRLWVEMIRKMFNKREVGFQGEIYSHEYQRKYHTDHSVAKVEPDPKQPTKFRLNIDGLEIYDWFCQKQKEFLHSIGVKAQEKRGMKI